MSRNSLGRGYNLKYIQKSVEITPPPYLGYGGSGTTFHLSILLARVHLAVGSVAEWLERRSLTGELTLIYA